MNPVDPTTVARHEFVQSVLGTTEVSIEPASCDASFRSYWRVCAGGNAAPGILMDASAAPHEVAPWLDVQQRLQAVGVHVPLVLASDAESGFVLMTDLGQRTYLDSLDVESVDTLYTDALDALLRMQIDADTTDLPDYDAARLHQEFDLVRPWFLERHLDMRLDPGQGEILDTAVAALVDDALTQPRCFVHRDFHSRNLMFLEQDNPGVIDFQDAVCGPITYDLASLLRDCYIAWDDGRVYAWVDAYADRLRKHGKLSANIDARQFRRWFDWIGLQRHIKVLGIFCRLRYRDGKSGYLAALPRVYTYVIATCNRYPEFAPLTALLESAVKGRDLTHAHTT